MSTQAPAHKSPRTLGYLLAVLAGCSWASFVVIGRLLAATDVDPLTIVTLRLATAFVILAGVLAVVDRRLLSFERRDLPLFLGYGLCQAANFAFYFLAIKYTTGTTAVILMYTYPAFVAGLGRLFLGERLDRHKVLALVCVLFGSFLVAGGWSPGALGYSPAGIAAGFAAALGMAAASILGKRAVRRYSSWTVVLWGLGFGTLFLGAALLGRLDTVRAVPGEVWVGILLAALVPALAAHGLFIMALTHIEATRASLAAGIEPVAGAVLAWLFLGERLVAAQWLGAAAVLAGVVAIQARDLGWRPAGRRRGGRAAQASETGAGLPPVDAR